MDDSDEPTRAILERARALAYERDSAERSGGARASLGAMARRAWVAQVAREHPALAGVVRDYLGPMPRPAPARWLAHEGVARVAAWSPDGQRLLTCGHDGAAKVWDASSADPLFQVAAHDKMVLSASWGADGGCFVTGGGDHRVRRWGASAGELQRDLQGHVFLAQGWASQGGRLAAFSPRGPVHAWDAASGALLAELPAQLGAEMYLA
jgi:hypothetical protein